MNFPLKLFVFLPQKNHKKLMSTPGIVMVIKSRRLRWAGYVARMEEDRSAFNILTGTPTGKRPLGRPRLR